ncbi:MAG: sugar-binding protein [bacterium]
MRQLILIFILGISQPAASLKRDSLPPRVFHFIPGSGQLLVGNDSLCLGINAKDNESGIERVNFFANYMDANMVPQSHIFAGKCTSFPYRLIWNCSAIPDQTFWWVWIEAEVTDSAGNITRTSTLEHKIPITLDRNHELKALKAQAGYLSKSPLLDGNDNDWPKNIKKYFFPDSLYSVSFRAAVNKQGLWFFVTVNDSNICVPQKKAIDFIQDTTVAFSTYLYDAVEFSFDFTGKRSPWKNMSTPEWIINPDGVSSGYFVNPATRTEYSWGEGAKAFVKISGSLNNFNSKDTGYNVEVVFPWKAFGLEFKDKHILGFDLFKFDITDTNKSSYGAKEFISWSGVTALGNDNPSEWGILVFAWEIK